MSNLSEILKLVWPIIVIQLALQIYALVDLFRKKETKTLSLPLWIIIIIFGEIVGAILYLLFGRKEE
jgi:uncharacterized membrane protein